MNNWPKYALMIAGVLAGSNAFGAAARTFVAFNGNDSNTSVNCGLTAPCRTFNAALSVTTAGGEIVVLDSAGYGTINITKSVSITAPDGVYAGITVPASADGIDISGSGVAVALKGLTINGAAGNNGIAMTSGASLSVGNCSIIGNPNVAASGIYTNGAITVKIVNSTIRDGYDGISLVNGAMATIAGVRLLDNFNAGLNVQGDLSGAPTTVSVVDTVATGSTNGNGNGSYGSGVGFHAQSLVGGGSASLSIDRSVASGNGVGIESSNWISGNGAVGTVTVVVSNSLISDNNYGLLAPGASARMYLNGSTITNSASCAYAAGTPDIIYTYGNNAVINSSNCGSSMVAVPSGGLQ